MQRNLILCNLYKKLCIKMVLIKERQYMAGSGQNLGPPALYPGKNPGTKWTGGGVGTRDVLDVLEKKSRANLSGYWTSLLQGT
jgi:hypothetical protein